jgi:hypothetical protein
MILELKILKSPVFPAELEFQKKIKSCALNLKKARISANSMPDQWVTGGHGSIGTRE